jgi:hypothetical protein
MKCEKVEQHFGDLGWHRMDCRICKKSFGSLYVQDIGYGDNGLIEFTCNGCISKKMRN